MSKIRREKDLKKKIQTKNGSKPAENHKGCFHKSNRAAIICSKHKPRDSVKKKKEEKSKTREKLFQIFDKCSAQKDSSLRPKMLKENIILSYFH